MSFASVLSAFPIAAPSTPPNTTPPPSPEPTSSDASPPGLPTPTAPFSIPPPRPTPGGPPIEDEEPDEQETLFIINHYLPEDPDTTGWFTYELTFAFTHFYPPDYTGPNVYLTEYLLAPNLSYGVPFGYITLDPCEPDPDAIRNPHLPQRVSESPLAGYRPTGTVHIVSHHPLPARPTNPTSGEPTTTED